MSNEEKLARISQLLVDLANGLISSDYALKRLAEIKGEK